MAEARFFAAQAWVGGRWERDVLLVADAQGLWSSLRAGSAPDGAQLLQGPVIPGLVDAHSHAFQRAIAGLTERSAGGKDDFWSWRDRMYSAALRIGPRALEAIAAFLYAELLRNGYTHVCEFHYLHHDTQGQAHAQADAMSQALLRAAEVVGIGITLLPTLYMRSGFGAKGLREDQRRFASTPDFVLKIAQAARAGGGVLRSAGIALHSLRAVDEGALREAAQAARAAGMPVHIHIAEQQQEVDDCLAHRGRRPIEWLLAHQPIDAAWNLVHATHTTRDELAGVAQSGASIVLCPSTEANLGDGVFDLPGWQQAGGRWSIGSDSHVTRSAAEELRLLEYSQRFVLRQRNIAGGVQAAPTAAALFEGALQGGTAAAGLPLAGIAPGQRADFCVLDAQAPALAGMPEGHALDAFIFSAPAPAIAQVAVAGRVIPAPPPEIAAAFRAAMRELWSATA